LATIVKANNLKLENEAALYSNGIELQRLIGVAQLAASEINELSHAKTAVEAAMVEVMAI
jgi:hypothetical protein